MSDMTPKLFVQRMKDLKLTLGEVDDVIGAMHEEVRLSAKCLRGILLSNGINVAEACETNRKMLARDRRFLKAAQDYREDLWVEMAKAEEDCVDRRHAKRKG